MPLNLLVTLMNLVCFLFSYDAFEIKRFDRSTKLSRCIIKRFNIILEALRWPFLLMLFALYLTFLPIV